MDNDSDKTWGDLVREYFPDAGGDEADNILWVLTAFPFADVETIRGHLAWLVQPPAAVRYVSCEPLLAGLDFRPFLPGLDLVITGGETGQKYKDIRPVHPAWLRSLRDQCADAGVNFFFQAWGEWIPRTQIPDFHVNQPGMTPPFVATHAWQEPLLHAPWGTLDIRGNFWPKTTTRNGRHEAPENDYEVTVIRAGKKFTGRLLDGREHNDLPGKLDRRDHPEIRQGLLL